MWLRPAFEQSDGVFVLGFGINLREQQKQRDEANAERDDDGKVL